MRDRRLWWVVLVALLIGGRPGWAQTVAATIRGRVVDLQTGEPIAKATVSANVQGAVTDEEGRFTLNGLGAASVELRVSTVGYGLLKRRVNLVPGQVLEVELRLGREAARGGRPVDVQQVTVTTGPYDPVVGDAVTQYSLNDVELQDLSTILANDPLRAVAALPGVSANQDAYADFATRGVGLSHVGVYLNGVLVEHPAYALEDSGDLGSLSIVNGEMVGSLSLLPGAFPASYGNRDGAILDVTTRDGARDRVATRFLADVLGATVVSEGPLGRAGKASWLVSGRQSYLGYLLERLGSASGLTLNFNDVSGSVRYDPNSRHQLRVYGSFGSNSAFRTPNYAGGQEPSSFTHGQGEHGLGVAGWSWTPSANTLVRWQGSWTHDHEHDTNQEGAVDLETTTNALGVRGDVSRTWGRNQLTAGVEARRPQQTRDSYQQFNYATDMLSPRLLAFDAYARSMWQTGVYGDDTVALWKKRVSVGGGARVAYYPSAGQVAWLPHASVVAKAAKGTTVSFAVGQYAQPPSLQQLYGAFGKAALRAERATHETLAVDQFLSDKVRVHVELYNRQERGVVYSPQTEFRIRDDGFVGFPVLGPVLGNSLKGYGRGVEISLQRRSANRLSGFVSYARSYSQYWQPGTALRFEGDYDQRNTFSAYGAYRITRTIDVSGNSRFGSGLPIAGFLDPASVRIYDRYVIFQLSQQRNTLRQGNFLRSDVRINKVFTRRHYNLTVHGELENLTGHVNYSYYGFVYPPNVGGTGQVYGVRDKTLPLLPVAGFTLEF